MMRCCWRRFGAVRIFTRARRRKFLASGRWRRPRTPARGESDQFRNYLRTFAFWAGAAARISSSAKRRNSSTPISRAISGVKEYLDNTLAEVRASGVAKTLFGRIRPIPEINSAQFQLRNFAERTALNSPLQGTAADFIKLAMISIDRRLAEENLEQK